MFDVEQAIVNAAKARNRAALAAFRALKLKMELATARPGGLPAWVLSEKDVRNLMRAEIRERKEFNEFVPPSSDDYQKNQEIIAVLTARLGRSSRGPATE